MRHAACHVRDPDGLGVDVGVGGPQHGPLERRQGATELVALVEVRGGAAHRLLGHPQLDGTQARCGPGRASTAPPAAPSVRPGQDVAGRHRGAVEMDVGMDLVVGRRGPLHGGARTGGVDDGHDGVVAARAAHGGGNEDAGGQMGLGDGEGGPVQAPALSVALGAHRGVVVRAGGDLGQRRGEPDVAGRHPGQPAGLLLGRAEARRGAWPRARWWPTAGRAPRPDPAARGRGTARSGPGPTRRTASGTARPRRLALASSDHSAASTRSAVFSTSPTRSGLAMPAKIAAAASDTACCSSVKSNSIRPPSPRRRAGTWGW